MVERSLEEQRISHRVIEFSSGSSLRKCLQYGTGIAVCPAVSVRKEVEQGLLVQFDWPGVETAVMMIWHQARWCSPLLKRFMDMARERLCQ